MRMFFISRMYSSRRLVDHFQTDRTVLLVVAARAGRFVVERAHAERGFFVLGAHVRGS